MTAAIAIKHDLLIVFVYINRDLISK